MIRIETPADIGETLALLRQLAGLTQQQLVAACGISQTEISLYEVGDRMPGPAKLLRHLAGLGWGLAIVPLNESGPETALSATESAEHGTGVEGEGVSEPNGPTGHTEVLALLRQALHLRTHGERAPGGGETWADWDRRAETLLRGVDDPEFCRPKRFGGDA